MTASVESPIEGGVVGSLEYGPPPSGQPIGPGGSASPDGQSSAASDHPGSSAPYAPVPFGPMDPPRKDKNWLGVASVISGILGAVPLAIGFGIGGLKAAKERRADNRPVAIVGLVASVAAPLVYTVLALSYFGLSNTLAAKSITYSDLSVGDCVLEPRGWENAEDTINSSFLKVVPCGNEHWGQIYFTERVNAATYPGNDAMDAKAVEYCESDAALNNVKAEFWPRMHYGSLLPTGKSWENYRTIVCILMPESGTLSQSWVVDK